MSKSFWVILYKTSSVKCFLKTAVLSGKIIFLSLFIYLGWGGGSWGREREGGRERENSKQALHCWHTVPDRVLGPTNHEIMT